MWRCRALPQSQAQASQRPCRGDFRYEEHAGQCTTSEWRQIDTTSSDANIATNSSGIFVFSVGD